MNEIEQAIKAIENIAEYWTCRPSERQAAQLALAALREQAEREKGCEHCTGDIDARTEIIIGEFDGDEICVWINSDNSLVVTDTHGLDYDDEIRFCPMCGKRLEVEP